MAPRPLTSTQIAPPGESAARIGWPLLATSAERALFWSPKTMAFRWCAECGGLLGLALWPRETHVIVHTHGLCRWCLAHLLEAADQTDRDEALGGVEARPGMPKQA